MMALELFDVQSSPFVCPRLQKLVETIVARSANDIVLKCVLQTSQPRRNGHRVIGYAT